MLRSFLVLGFALVAGSCGGDTAGDAPRVVAHRCVNLPRPARAVGVRLSRVAGGFRQPVFLLPAPGDGRLFVVEREGRMKAWSGAEGGEVFIDLSARVEAMPGEGGLLGAAFHPRFAQNGQVFLSFTDSVGGLRSVVARYESKDGGKTLDPTSEKIIFSLAQPFTNHNGGMIAFGPDGLLYIGLGDGGAANDPLGSGQDTGSLLGKILRIDVDGGEPYGIPQDNPFAQGGGRPEIFAHGLRNPWRFSFDRATGDLWAGDVGQDRYEEVDLIRLGGNYGWNTMEGFHCFNPQEGCSQAGLSLPVVEYDHGQGVSITGGYVYRGKAVPELRGSYVYGDFDSGRIWRVRGDAADGPEAELLMDSGLPISSFGEDNEGEVYVVAFNQGEIFRFEPGGFRVPEVFPQKLSQTGCFDPADVAAPSAALVAYEVNAPLWSDGADKRRWLALPDGAKIDVGPDGDMDLPVGSATIKEFSIGGRRVETRLLVRHDDGGWSGYSYEWDEDGKDATLLSGSKKKAVGGQTWHYPSGAECSACHTSAAGRTLGLEVAQLERPDPAGEGQLERLSRLGLFSSALPVEQRPRLPDPRGQGEVEARARAYLHSNCSFCHRPQGTGRGPADFRFTTPLAGVGVCGVAPEQGDLGVAGVKLLDPGAPSNSVISLRMHRRDAKGMPPVATSQVDEASAALIDGWISGLSGCP